MTWRGTHTFSFRLSIRRHLWLRWTVTTLRVLNISQDRARLSADSKSLFYLSARRNQVVLNRVGPGRSSDSLPRHELRDNKQGTDLNSIKSFTDESLSFTKKQNI